MSVLVQLDEALQALRALKPPGVTKGRIATITNLCVENVKSESVLVQKIYTHFKKSPSTHKLGVLYVVDSVTRQWLEKAAATGQDVAIAGNNAPDGSYAAGVNRVTELLPILMNDLCPTAPEDQKEKIFKLIDIWERGNVFPSVNLGQYKEILSKPTNSTEKPTVTLPDSSSQQRQQQQQQPQAAPEMNGLQGLSALLGGGYNQHQSARQPQGAPVPIQQAPQQQQQQQQQQQLAPQNTNVNNMPLLSALLGGQQPQQQTLASSQVPSLPTLPQPNNLLPQNAIAAAPPPALNMNNSESLSQYLQLLQKLTEMGIPQEQWGTVINALNEQINAQKSAEQTTPQTQTPLPVHAPAHSHAATHQQPTTHSQSDRSRNRSRSPVRRRESPVYGAYRTRSPQRSGSPPMQPDQMSLAAPKWTDLDSSLREGCIKVYSRTLFIGGATAPEDDIRKAFQRFGNVQTCIVNADKRHAFVKMMTRAEAVAAKEGMENCADPTLGNRIRTTKWGVGFGPRECCDYASGTSIIQIDRLTEADRKWALTAPVGGTGGIPLTTGLVMEEPDIEIGAGVSSKAMSRKMPGPEFRRRNKDQHGNHGRQNERNNERRNERAADRHQSQQANAPPNPISYQPPPQHHPPSLPQYDFSTVGAPPAVPGFGFQFPSLFPPQQQPSQNSGGSMPPYR